MKIHVLIENTTTDTALTCQHGLSLLIEEGDKRILLDAGNSDAFLENARRMDVDLGHIDAAVLSHGHWDHSGGFAAFLSQDPARKLYIHELADKDYWSDADESEMHYIGIPEALKTDFDSQIHRIYEKTEILPGVWLLPHTTSGLERIGARMHLYRMNAAGEIVPDDFAHEISLVIDTTEGLCVFNSCSHAGVRAILSEVREAFPGKPLFLFAGGLHMMGKKNGIPISAYSAEEIHEMAEFLRACGLKQVLAGHCTGAPAYEMLHAELGNMLKPLSTGLTYAF